MSTVGVSLPVVPGSGIGAAQATANMAAKKSIIITGNFTGNVIVEAAAIAGGPFCQIRTFSGPVRYTVEIACAEMRVVSQNTTGAPVVDVSSEDGVVQAVNLNVPAGDGAGVASNISALGELMTAYSSIYGTGALFVELSEDGVNWVQGFSTFTPAGGCQTRTAPANFARVVRAGVTIGAAPVVQLAAASGAGGSVVAEPRTCFVWRPNGVAGDNVYTDFASLMAAVNSVEGCKTILADFTLAAGVGQIPPGAWDFTDVKLEGVSDDVAGVRAEVQILAGATLTSTRTLDAFVFDNVIITNLGADPPPASPIGPTLGQQVVLRNGAQLRSGGAANPVIFTLVDFTLVLDEGSSISNNAGAGGVVIEQGAGTLTAIVNDGCQIEQDVLQGAGAAAITKRGSSSVVDGRQALLGGGVTVDPEYAENVFVFRPGGVPAANVYVEWASLVSALGAVDGTRELLFDDSLGACIVPAGAYDMAGVTWSGGGPGASADVTFAAGATVTNLSLVRRNLTLLGAGAAAAVLLTAGQRLRFEDGGGVRAAAGPIIDIAAGATAEIELGDEVNIVNFGASPVNVNAGSLAGVLLEGALAGVSNDAFVGAGNATVFVRSTSATVDGDQSTLGGAFAVDNETIDRSSIPAVDAATPATAQHGQVVRVDASAGDFTVNLPPSSLGNVGQSVVAKKVDGGTNNVILNPAGADTIVGRDRTPTAFGSIEVVDNGDGTWSTVRVPAPIEGNLWAPPAVPSANDDEFSSVVLDGAWSEDFVAAGGIDPYAAFAAGAPRRQVNSYRRSWYMVQPPGDGAEYHLTRSEAIPDDLLIWCRASFAYRLLGGPVNNDNSIGIGFAADDGGGAPDDNNRLHVFINETDAAAIQAEYVSLVAGVPTTIGLTTDIDNQGQPIVYAAVQKIGGTYHGWCGTEGGNWIHMGSVTPGWAPVHKGFLFVNAAIASPGNMILGADFYREIESALILP